MIPSPIRFRLVPDVRQGITRAVGILEGDKDLCAEKLLNLSKKDSDYQKFSMESWASGNNKPDSRFHRYDGTDYFVFKQVAKMHRFYGFLCHPKVDKSFLVCVLTTYLKKKEDRSDPVAFKRIEVWMNLPATIAAIKRFYDDEPER